jgi:hypothetical protein
MSNRSLIEINHDFAGEIGSDTFRAALRRYLNSADRETAEALEPFGVRVIGLRHHSNKFIVSGVPDGFPVFHLDQPREPSK